MMDEFHQCPCFMYKIHLASSIFIDLMFIHIDMNEIRPLPFIFHSYYVVRKVFKKVFWMMGPLEGSTKTSLN